MNSTPLKGKKLMYFVLEEDREYAFMAAFEDANPGHDLKWMMGQPIGVDEKPSKLKLTIEEPLDQYPDFFTETPVTFCSKRLQDRLKAAGVDNIEYYPVDMVDKSGKRQIDGYFAMNVIGRIKCMDRQRSKFTEWDERVARIHSLSLKKSAMKGLKVFRPDEYQEIILVSADVGEALRGLPGVLLMPAEGWSDTHRF